MTAAHRIAVSCFAAVLCLPAFAAAQNIADGGGYAANYGFYDFVDATVAGIDLGLSDDGEVELPLPFTFSYFGNDYNFVTVGANGGFAFTDGTGSTRHIGFSNSEFPSAGNITSSSAGPPDVAPLWDDWNPSNGGAVYVLDDSVANDRAIVSWVGVPHFSNVPDASFQAHIYSDGTIQFHYADVNDIGAGAYDNGVSATIGIQDGDSAGGTYATGGVLAISFNAPVVEDFDAIVFTFAGDVDGDGWSDAAGGGADCDDNDASVNPDGVEVCTDGIDQNCDGYDQLTDFDLDGDIGVDCGGDDCDDFDASVSSLVDGDGDGSNACDDCDDAEAAAFPGNVELCDSIDNDCDGITDDLDDLDGDGVTTCDGDCDDDDPDAFPGNPEVGCDGIDNDCDELTVDELDADLDGSACDADCDDADANSFPGNIEICDTVDNDCDGTSDEFDLDIGAVAGVGGDSYPGAPFSNSAPLTDTIEMPAASGAVVAADFSVEIDINHTWAGDVTATLTSPTGTVVELFSGVGGSANDFIGTVLNDGAATAITDGSAPFTGTFAPEGTLADFDTEVIDGTWTLDLSDCCGGDDGTLVHWAVVFVPDVVLDDDGDGAVDACGDCDPADETVFPGADEICGDTIDQNCDGADEEADNDLDGADDILCGGEDCDDADASVVPGADTDLDGFDACDGADILDCDDAVDTVYPGADEICDDAVDQDCDGEDFVGDTDGDTFGSTDCGGTDCDDGDATIFAGAPELCDDIDSSCDGLDIDTDGDGFQDNDCEGDDCDSADASINPAAVELCDTVDGDCDGIEDAFDLDIGAVAGVGGTSFPGLPFDNNNDGIDVITLPAASGVVTDLNVTLNIDHTWAGDVTAILRSPLGTEVELFSGVGGSANDFIDTVLDDEAATAIGDGAAPFTGTWIPENALSTFDTETIDGDWVLILSDCCGGDNGELVNWSLEFVAPVLDDADADGAVDGCGDCDNADDTVFPGAEEICGDTIDQDCDGADDVADFDGDLAENADCGGTDCDDADANAYPGAAEICADGIDQDCDEQDDDIFDADFDGDPCDTDCDDADPLAFNGFAELCDDGIDNDCDAGTPDLNDADGDGSNCVDDCDDTNPIVFPGSPEILCDNIDNDCDELSEDIDDGDSDTFDCDVDCDDSNPATNPAALEIPCDGMDNDCDGTADTDDGADNDLDGDGATCDVDCDDEDADRSPNFDELCDDGVDNDCNPLTTDDQDFDLDGFSCIDDCDDEDPTAFPGAPEICADSIDQDCDGVADELAADVYDLDNDDSLLIGLCSFSFPMCGSEWDMIYVQDNGRITFGFDDQTSAESVANLLDQTPQIAGLWTDLDPSLAGAVEVVEEDGLGITVSFTAVPQFGLDETANTFSMTLWADGTATFDYGPVDEVDGLVGFACGDGSTGDVTVVDYSADELPPNALGFGTGTDDAVYEQFSDLGSPNDLQDSVIELCLTAGDDTDGDGWTDYCGDCDDDDATTYPGADELCDTLDNNCDGVVDEVDVDEDGFLDGDCGGDDCDDASADSFPGAPELCDGEDNDCDGTTDDEELDGDGDGFAPCELDCDDTAGDINPDAEEICDIDANGDGIDNDCDGEANEGFTEDLDDDGYVSEACGGDDCDDTRERTNPDADEVCDLVDNDCNDEVDDIDADGDTYLDADCSGDDCDDSDADTNPGATEVPYDDIDNDCDGEDIVDADGDGFAATEAGGTDCDDGDADVNADAEEVCDDSIDNDCDDATDADDDTCGACSDCTNSVAGGNSGVAGMLFLALLGAVGMRRRRV